MSYYTVEVNEIRVIGQIWWPYGLVCANTYPLDSYDIKDIEEYGDGEITREAAERWLLTNSGDFSSIDDIQVHIGPFI